MRGRVAVGAAVLVLACLLAAGWGAVTGRAADGGSVRGASGLQLHGRGQRTFELGDGVRVYAFWTPGAHERPWVMNVHGGSWRYGSGAIASYLDWARHEQSRGWAAFTVDYRLTPTVTWPAPEHDVERAVAWVRAHAASFGLDEPHGFLIGHSAGGQLASIAGLQLGGFAGVASISGAVDPYYLYRDGPDHVLRHNTALLVGRKVHDRAAWASTAAASYVGPHVMPFLVMHSAHDPIVPETVGRTFADDLHRHGYPVRFVEVPGRDHALMSAHDDHVVDGWMDAVLAGPSAARTVRTVRAGRSRVRG